MQDCCLSIYPPAYHAVCLSMSFHHMCTHAVPGACRSVCTRGVCASSYNIDCVSDSISDETRLYCIQGPALHIDEWSRNYSRRSKSNGCISNGIRATRMTPPAAAAKEARHQQLRWRQQK